MNMITKTQIDTMTAEDIVAHVESNEGYSPSVLKRMRRNISVNGTGARAAHALRSELLKAEVSRYRRENDCNIEEAESMVIWGEIRKF